MMYIQHALDFLNRYPWLWFFFLSPLLGALCNFIWKPRSPQEYAELGPRLGGFLKFIASVFPDPRGAIQGISAMVTAKSVPAADLERMIARAASQDPKSNVIIGNDPPL